MKTVVFCGAVLLIAVTIMIAFRDSSRESPLPEVPVAQTPAEVRVKAVELNVETLDLSNAEAAKFSKKRPARICAHGRSQVFENMVKYHCSLASGEGMVKYV